MQPTPIVHYRVGHVKCERQVILKGFAPPPPGRRRLRSDPPGRRGLWHVEGCCACTQPVTGGMPSGASCRRGDLTPYAAGKRRGRHLEQAASIRRPLGCLVKARPAGLRPGAVRARRPRGDGHVHRLRPTGAAAHRHARAARRARDCPFLARRLRPGDLAQVPPHPPMRSRQRARLPAHPATPRGAPQARSACPSRPSCPLCSRLVLEAQGTPGAAIRMALAAGPHDLQAFWPLFAAGRQGRATPAGPSACARGAATGSGTYGRQTLHRGAHAPASRNRRRRACRPTGPRVPPTGPALAAEDRALLPPPPPDATASVKTFSGQGKSAGRVQHRLPLPGAPR